MANVEHRHSIDSDIRESNQSFGELVGYLIKQITSLVKGEIALASAQLQEKASAYASAAAFIVVGMGLSLLAAMSFLTAGIIALGSYVGLVLASVIIGAALAVPAVILITNGRSRFKLRRNT